VLRGAARSSAFLALYCTLCWRGACLGFQATGSCAPQVIAGSAWAGAHPSAAATLAHARVPGRVSACARAACPSPAVGPVRGRDARPMHALGCAPGLRAAREQRARVCLQQ